MSVSTTLKSRQAGGIACVACDSAPPRNFLICLNLQKIALF
jgi:hypothetical protein